MSDLGQELGLGAGAPSANRPKREKSGSRWGMGAKLIAGALAVGAVFAGGAKWGGDKALDDKQRASELAAFGLIKDGSLAAKLTNGQVPVDVLANLSLMSVNADDNAPFGHEFNVFAEEQLQIRPENIDMVISLLEAQGDEVPGANPGEQFYVPTSLLEGSVFGEIDLNPPATLIPIVATLPTAEIMPSTQSPEPSLEQ